MNRLLAKPVVGWLLASLLPVVLYLPTLHYSFVFDDRPLLIDNPVIQDPQGLQEIFTTDLDPRSRLQEAPTTNYLRPLFLALAAGLHELFGADPRGWHLAAVLLHGLLGGLALTVLRREGLSPISALVAALIFSLHPAHVQSTAWVSGLQDLLVAVLALFAFIAYRASAERDRWGDPAGLTGLVLLGSAYLLALLAKEPAVGLLLFALGDTFLPSVRPRRRPLPELALLATLTALYFAYRFAVLGKLAHRFPTAPAWPEALASLPIALLAYLRDLFWPVDLFLLHPARPVSSWLAMPALIAAAGLVFVSTLLFLLLKKRPLLRRPALFFIAWLAPALAIWAVHPEWMVMDRYLLLPSLALGWALLLLFPLGQEGGDPPFRLAVFLLLLATFGGLSWLGMRDFRDEKTFWTAAIAADPRSSTAWAEIARLHVEDGQLAKASEALTKAIDLDPQAQLPRLRRALLALRSDQPLLAATELEELIDRNPAYLPAWRNLVIARGRAGDAAGARRTLDQALERFPGDSVLWTHNAILLRGENRREEALEAIRRAMSLAPGDAGLRLREAMLLAELGRSEEAKAAANAGLALDPAPDVQAQLEKLAR